MKQLLLSIYRSFFPEVEQPKDGQHIRLTKLRPNNGAKNAYEGFEGVVEDFSNEGFCVRGKTSVLAFCRKLQRGEKFEVIA